VRLGSERLVGKTGSRMLLVGFVVLLVFAARRNVRSGCSSIAFGAPPGLAVLEVEKRDAGDDRVPTEADVSPGRRHLMPTETR
jgi:hypothetical protein